MISRTYILGGEILSGFLISLAMGTLDPTEIARVMIAITFNALTIPVVFFTDVFSFIPLWGWFFIVVSWINSLTLTNAIRRNK